MPGMPKRYERGNRVDGGNSNRYAGGAHGLCRAGSEVRLDTGGGRKPSQAGHQRSPGDKRPLDVPCQMAGHDD